MRTRSEIIASALLVLAGCGGGNGDGLDGGGQPLPPAPPPPPPANDDFQEIQDTIFTPICTACHVGAGAPQGLRLDAANSYALLFNVASNEVPGLLRVNPGNPNQSYLVQKIEGTAAVGGRMPLGGAPLSQAQIDLVRAWITAGAPMSVAPPGPLTVMSTIPAAGEMAAATSKLTVIFSGNVDASLTGVGVFVLRDGFDAPVAISKAVVPAGRPNVVELSLAQPLASGSYKLEVHGGGAVALADEAGRVLDGDADGKAGGDFKISFDVATGGAR